MEDQDRRHSKSNATDLGKALAMAFDWRSLALWFLPGTPRLSYVDGLERVGVEANDADPNVTPPAAALILAGGHPAVVNRLGLLPYWSGTAQAVVVDVYARTGLTAAGRPAWARVKRVAFVGDGTDTEQVVDVGCRDTFCRIVSGADAGHPFTLLIAVA